MRRTPTLLTIGITLLLGLTACDSTATPAGQTVAATQTAVNKTFTTWVKQIPKTDVLKTKAHAGRTTLGTSCTNNKVQLLDTYAVYVTKDFDGTKFLDTFQTYLDNNGGKGTRTTDTSKNQVINLNRDGYAYQILSLTNVKIDTLDSKKAILFAVTGPCVKIK